MAYRSVFLLSVVLVWKTVLGASGGILGLPQVDLTEKDLLQAIKIPFDDPITTFFDYGLDGFPAMGLKPGSDIKSPYRLYMPEKFYPEFAITVTSKLANKEGGFIFAVVNPLETVVQLGVHLGPAGPGMTNISLLYTDLSIHYTSQTIASFVVPSSFTKWTRFGMKVTIEEVVLYFKCEEFERLPVKREPQELVFDSASTLYIGQAGPLIKGNFDVIFTKYVDAMFIFPVACSPHCTVLTFTYRTDIKAGKIIAKFEKGWVTNQQVLQLEKPTHNNIFISLHKLWTHGFHILY